MRLAICAMALVCLPVFAQDNDPATSFSGGPPNKAWTTLYYYTVIGGADSPEYVCKARTSQPSVRTDITQVVVATNTGTVTTSLAHGLGIGNKITIANSTTSTLNGTYIILTAPSSTTFTITTSGVADATYTATSIFLTSSAPRTNRGIWAIQKYFYGGTGGATVLAVKWAVKPGNTISGTGSDLVCDDRTTLAYQ